MLSHLEVMSKTEEKSMFCDKRLHESGRKIALTHGIAPHQEGRG